MEITFSKHFLGRKKLRGIPDGLAESLYAEADEHFEDRDTGALVAVKRIYFCGKMRDVALVYTKNQDRILLITLHPLKEGQKEKRIQSGRWVRL